MIQWKTSILGVAVMRCQSHRNFFKLLIITVRETSNILALGPFVKTKKYIKKKKKNLFLENVAYILLSSFNYYYLGHYYIHVGT